MRLEFDLISVIIILGVSQGILLAVSLFFRKAKDKNQARSYKLLAFFLLAVSACLSSSLFYRTHLFRYLPHITLITDPFRMLLGPLLYFYVKELTILNFSFSTKKWTHFLPFMIYLVILMPFYLQDSDYKINYVREIILNADLNGYSFHKLMWFLASIHFVGYLIIIQRLINKHNNQLKDIYASIDSKITLKWVNIFLTFLLAIVVGFFLFNTVAKLMDRNLIFDIRIFHIIMTTFLYGLAYRGLNQQSALNFEPDTTQLTSASSTKYETSKITKRDSVDYYKKLVAFMETQKPYTDPDLNLSTLAKSINIPKRYLSQVINEHSNHNFYRFVNQYRIDLSKTMLLGQNNPHYSILDISYEAGFNSKSTFNKAFKQITGLTPSQYRKKNSAKKLC